MVIVQNALFIIRDKITGIRAFMLKIDFNKIQGY